MEEYSSRWMEKQLLCDKSSYYETCYCPACNRISKPYFQVGKFEYLICTNCNTVFEKQRPTELGAERIYNSIFTDYLRCEIEIPAYYSNSTEKYSMQKKTLDLLKKQLFSYVSNNNSVLLDYASGLGIIADYYCKSNKFDRVYYFEINKFALEFIRKNFKELELFNNNVQVDVIILYAALEHFSDPYSTLREISNKLKSKGIMQIFIPYMGPITRKYFPNMYQMLNSGAHVNFFSEKGLKELGERLDMRVSNIVYLQNNNRYLYNYLYSKKAHQAYQFILNNKTSIKNIISGYLIKDKFYDNTNYGNFFIRNASKAFNKLNLNFLLKILDKGACLSAILKKN